MKVDVTNFTEEEVEDLIQGIYAMYGYDFRGYARASLHRRIKRFLTNKKLSSLAELEAALFRDSYYFENFLQEVTVNVTEMFRDTTFYLSLRENVLPILSTYPHIKVWDAGCSTGEELISLSILFEEAGMLDRTKIYATDVNQKALRQAKDGIYPASNISHYTTGYYAAGGKREFSTYYRSNYGSIKFDSALTRKAVFYPHNLATDSSFNEFHLIICRNVLIYFNRELQKNVFKLFNESLVTLGYLGLGMKETLTLEEGNNQYTFIDKKNRIYRKTN